MNCKLIIFDWDGTLADSTAAIVQAMQQAAPQCGLPVPTEESVLDIIGLGLPEAIFRVWPGIDQAQMLALRQYYAEHYIQLTTEESRLFPGVPETLHGLRRTRRTLAVATGKSRQGLERALRSTGLGDHFETSRCADEGAGKPDPEMLHVILDQLGVRPEQAIMVGDTEYDLDMAERAGMRSVGVSYGAHDAQRLRAYNPLTIIDRIDELLDLLSDAGA